MMHGLGVYRVSRKGIDTEDEARYKNYERIEQVLMSFIPKGVDNIL